MGGGAGGASGASLASRNAERSGGCIGGSTGSTGAWRPWVPTTAGCSQITLANQACETRNCNYHDAGLLHMTVLCA